MSPIYNVCAGCHRLVRPEDKVRGRCPSCAKAYEKARIKRRLSTTEPWQWLYSHRRWRDARARVLARDGHRCRAAGCNESQGLEVHHSPVWVGVLWSQALGSREVFLRLACDEANLVSSCKSHHRQADEARRKRTRGRRA
jgi:hypothetical protein